MFFSGLNFAPVAQRQYLSTDMSEYTLGVQASSQGWTYPYNSTNFSVTFEADATAPSGVRMTIDKTVSADVREVTWDRAGSSLTTVEALGLFKFLATPAAAGGTLGGMDVRVSGAYASRSYYTTLTIKSAGGSTHQFQLGKEVSSGGGTPLNTAAQSWDNTNWWWIRTQASGTTIRARIWQYGTSEPGTWTVTATDSSISTGGVGFGTFETDANYSVGWLAVATGGATAPFPNG